MWDYLITTTTTATATTTTTTNNNNNTEDFQSTHLPDKVGAQGTLQFMMIKLLVQQRAPSGNGNKSSERGV